MLLLPGVRAYDTKISSQVDLDDTIQEFRIIEASPVALKKGDNDSHLQCVLTAGVYLARVTAGNHTLHTERFVTH